MIKHLAFFEELANGTEDGPEWREGQAGLLVLRLVDTWFEQGPRPPGKELFGVAAIRQCVGQVHPGKPVRGILSSIVDAVEAAPVPDANVVNARLLAYGQALEYDAKWRLASDVYGTVVELTDPGEDAESIVLALLRSGYCQLMVDDLEPASGSYRAAEQVSVAVGDARGGLRARIGQAKLAIHRGNLPAAELMLDAVIEDAAAQGLPGVQSLALHDRAHVASLRGEHERSIQLAYRALETAGTPRDRDRVLADIAMLFFTMGMREAARDAYLILTATAQEQYVRWTSTLSLMSIAAADGARALFEDYKRQLQHSDLAPVLQAEFALEVGKGLLLLGQSSDVRRWFERSLEIAQAHRLNQWIFAAEQALEGLAVPVVVAKAPDRSAEVDTVADALREMRLSAQAAHRS